MGVWRSASLGMALAALMAVPPSAAGRSPNSSDEQVRATGSIVYTWHGDPARGCAQAGVCGIHGALVIQPEGDAEVNVLGSFGSEIDIDGVSSTVRVLGGDLGPGGECVDQVEGDPSAMELIVKRRGGVAATFGGAVSSGRCAGPLAQDLERLLIRGRRSSGRRPTYDFRGSLPFTAGPYSGTLESTLVLRPARSNALSGTFSIGGSGSSSVSPTRRVLVEEVDLRYRVSAAPGTLDFSFAGGSGPFCTALNSCGARGSLALAFPRLTREVQITALRLVKHRVSRRQALRDFRAGKLQILGGAPVNWVAPQLTETFADQGTCTDSVAVPQLGLVFGALEPGSSRVLPIAVTNFEGPDPLRTRCPGPESGDVVGGDVVLARTRVTPPRLLEPRSTFSLNATGAFGSPGYTGTRRGRLTLTLSLLKIHAGTHAERM